MATNLLAYKSHGDNVLVYISDDGIVPGKVRAVIREDNKDYPLRELAAGSTYLLEVARFDNSWYFVAGAASENKIYEYRNPVAALKSNPTQKLVPTAVLKIDNPSSVSFSTNSRFVVAQSGQKFAVYDAEDQRQFRYELTQPLAIAIPATWMDGHRLQSVSDGKVIIWDFDGINIHSLVAADSSLPAFFDPDYEYIYTIAPAPEVAGRYALLQTSLRATR